ncbi:Ser/Thr protein phosphatase family protein [Neorickettsia risticii str. Illinois]|uniref:Ser/Thr protein phosphatase family protein n=2 Tax=Neorickettsia risticii TaxID=950 RepID=C6V5U7_NEORI|nr:Ser/Thr protein phosphatase family protein [Neorickettsia risticii str. Illinois]
MKWAINFSFLCFLLFGSASGESFHWFQLMGGNQLWFRFVVEEEDVCPEVVVDGVEYVMDQHHAADGSFPLSCVYKLNLEDLPQSFIFGNKEILPRFNKDAVTKIAVIGDTGCRNNHFFSPQDCKKEWFFKEIIDAVLEHIPEMVIHVGDYVYKEGNRPNTWVTWKEDFFLPAADLLHSNTPLLLVRGNHEHCSTGGEGWAYFLSSAKKCLDYESPYTVSLNGFDIVVTDSSTAVKLYEDVAHVNDVNNGKRTWIVTHRPLVFKNKESVYAGDTAIFKDLKKEIELIMSGHVHVAQFLRLDGHVQFISGNSGALLSHWQTGTTSGSRLEYGFAVIDLLNDNARITSYDRFNNEMMSMYLRAND